MKKKFLLALMLIMLTVIALGTISISAMSSGTCGKNVNYTLDAYGVLTISGSGDMLDYYANSRAPWYSERANIKKVKVEYGVTKIGNYSFYDCSSITSIYISDSVETINGWAFYGCENLEQVIIPNSVTSIGKGCFSNCTNLKNIALSTNISSIPEYSFYECIGLTEIYLSDNISEIGERAFYSCTMLKRINIPYKVKNIGKEAFSYCTLLEYIEWNAENIADFSAGNSIFRNAGENGNGIEFVFTDSVKRVPAYLFDMQHSMNRDTYPYLSSVTFGKNIIEIGAKIFPGNKPPVIYYNNTEEKWDEISIHTNNSNLLNTPRINFYYVEILNKDSQIAKKIKNDINSVISVPELPHKKGYTIKLYTDIEYTAEFDMSEPIKENKTLYYEFIINKYKHKFIDFDGTVLKEETVDYGTIIIPPKTPARPANQQYTYTFSKWTGYSDDMILTDNITFHAEYQTTVNQYTYKYIDENGTVIKKETVDYGTKIELPEYTPKANTQQYTYTFLGWDGYTDGMIVTDDVTFTPQYQETINQYTYKFIDEDGSVIKEETVDYGTTIIPPTATDKTEYYLFDYWTGYTEGIILTDDITFEAVYKYNDYNIIAGGLSDAITVTYNDNFSINPQAKDGYTFVGYFTEKDGAGSQITNEKGESLNVYKVIGDLKVYPYFYSNYMNTVELQGVKTTTPGDTITQRAIFATDKDATYFIATVKYPKYLNFKSIKGIDFKEATKDSEKVVGEYKYLDITCVFDYEGNFAEINTNYIPFEIEFQVATDIPEDELNKEYMISVENVLLIGEDTYEITDITNHTITILPKLAESIEIIGSSEIDKTTQFTVAVSPDYTTDKSVVWSVDDESVATITQDGTITPVKNGKVVITATAKDGSEVFKAKTVNVIAYAKINSLDFGSGVVLTEFNPDLRKYTVYVKEDATSISLTPTFSGGGVLRPNGSGVWVSGRPKDFDLNDTITTITLNRDNVTDMTNSIYTIEVIKFEGTKTEISEDKKSFTITPINVEIGKTVILALYTGEQFVEMQSAVYTGDAVSFTTTKTYTKSKVMVWDDLTYLKPVCNAEELN